MTHADLLPESSGKGSLFSFNAKPDAVTATPLRPIYPRCGRTTGQLPELESIFDNAVSLSILRRPTPLALKHYLADQCPRHTYERAQRISVEQPEFATVLQDFSVNGRTHLEDELRSLIELFATLSDSHSVGMRLCLSHQQSCPRFHVDRIGLRLICTWQGPGTEWLEHADVDRRFLGFGSQGVPDECSGLLRAGAQIYRMQTFDIGLFKGELWPGNAGRGAVHRSPEVKPLSPHRIVVTLDELE